MVFLQIIVCGVRWVLLVVSSWKFVASDNFGSGEVSHSQTDTTTVLLWALGMFDPSISGSKSGAFI